MSEFAVILIAIVMWGMGFLTCGALIGNTPFWDGVREAWTFGARNRRHD